MLTWKDMLYFLSGLLLKERICSKSSPLWKEVHIPGKFFFCWLFLFERNAKSSAKTCKSLMSDFKSFIFIKLKLWLTWLDYTENQLTQGTPKTAYNYYPMSQGITKPAIRLVQPAKTQISLHICAVWSVFDDCMYLLQLQGYSKRNKQEHLPYWVVVQADLSLCWSQRSYWRFCHALALITFLTLELLTAISLQLK